MNTLRTNFSDYTFTNGQYLLSERMGWILNMRMSDIASLIPTKLFLKF